MGILMGLLGDSGQKRCYRVGSLPGAFFATLDLRTLKLDILCHNQILKKQWLLELS